jgi:arylsulfatase A-like enzyme
MRCNMRSERVAGILAVVVLWLSCSGCTREEKPNLIVIVVDTLRADHLGCYGYGRPTSPGLDRLAGESVLFENAYASSSWTAPSIASLFTSVHPSVHGVTTFAAALPDSLPTMAEVLQRQGFRNTGLSANFVHIIERKGFGRGFDSFAELRRPVTAGEEAEFAGFVAADAQTVTTRAIEAARASRDSRFFLYVHYMDPHSTYAPPEPFRSRFARPYDGPFTGATNQLKSVMQGELAANDADLRRLVDLYDAEIAFTDAEIGRLLDELRRLDLLDNSVVAVLSDHGEEFGEHGGVFHGVTLYDEMTHVPLLVRLPGGRHGGTRVRPVVQIVDLGPTLLEAVGVEDDRRTQGRSFAELLAARDTATSAAPAFSELHADEPVEAALRPRTHRTAITTRDWTWIGGKDATAELYDRRTDPQQQRNRVQNETAVAASLGQDAEAFAGALRDWGTADGGQVPLRPEDREQMRALGYLR